VTLSQQLVQRKIGSLPPNTMQQVNACLAASLGL
jgi:hypothetical protein